jgi:hypothetical protein
VRVLDAVVIRRLATGSNSNALLQAWPKHQTNSRKLLLRKLRAYDVMFRIAFECEKPAVSPRAAAAATLVIKVIDHGSKFSSLALNQAEQQTRCTPTSVVNFHCAFPAYNAAVQPEGASSRPIGWNCLLERSSCAVPPAAALPSAHEDARNNKRTIISTKLKAPDSNTAPHIVRNTAE